MTQKRVTTAIALITALALAGLLHFVLKSRAEEKYREFASPDGRFKVVVYRSLQEEAMMPGQSGDAPGHVCLYDAAGRLLEKKPVEMVQLVEWPEWSKTNVYIKFIADWELH